MPSRHTYKTTTFSSQIRPERTTIFHPDSSGKEKDAETGYHYFGARYYNSDLSIWLSVDPMSDKYPSLSPYNYCAWNPMKLVDPDGEDTLVFNQNGMYSHTIKSKGEHVGRFERSAGKAVNFSFADPINDPISIENGSIKKVFMISDEFINEKISNSGVFDNKDLSFIKKLEYLYNHSNATKNDGVLDYLITGNLSSDLLYLVKNADNSGEHYTGHNCYNFGNFLWGASVEVLGVPLLVAKTGGHVNNFLFDYENAGKKIWQRRFDSKDDQRSISLGYNWAKKHAKKN